MALPRKVRNVSKTLRIMCITSQGTSVRVEAKDITVQGRSASGIKVVTITDPDYVVGVDRIANEEDEK